MADPAPAGRARASRRQRVAIVIGVLVSLGLAADALASIPPSDLFATLDYVASISAAVSLVLSGAVLVWRLPGHPVGWLLWSGGFLFAIANGAEGLSTTAVAGAPSIAGWLQLAGDAAWVPAIVCVTVLLPLVFPNGHLPSPRWRIVVAIGVLAVIFNVVQSALTPFDPTTTHPGIVNPIGASGFATDLGNVLGALSSGSGVICLPLVAASLIRRFRHASGVERAQLKWLAAAIGLAGPAVAFGIVVARLPGDVASVASDIGFLVAFIGFGLLPVAIGIAVLRYRLYDIDLIIRRTVVYVPLTAILAGLYAGTTALFQKVFIAVTGERSDAAVIASTLILATLFTPIRTWLQGIVDRRFRDQVDARRQLDAYVKRVSTSEWKPDPARTLRGFLIVAVGELETAGGRAFLDIDGHLRLVAVEGTPTATATAVDVASVGRRVGRLELALRDRDREYRAGEMELLRDAARRLADAIFDEAWVPDVDAAGDLSAETADGEMASYVSESGVRAG